MRTCTSNITYHDNRQKHSCYVLEGEFSFLSPLDVLANDVLGLLGVVGLQQELTDDDLCLPWLLLVLLWVGLLEIELVEGNFKFPLPLV